MKTIAVTTPDNIQVEYRLAGAGSRVGAAVIDTAIQAALFVAVTLAALWILFDFSLTTFFATVERAFNVFAVVLALYFVIFFGYFLILEIIMNGQTPGKRVFGLRTIRQNGQPITFIQSIIRNILRVMVDNTGVGIVMMMLAKNHTRLGDILAGTIVISESADKYSTASLLWEVANDPREGASPTLNIPYPLSTGEYEILKDYFARIDDFADGGRYAGLRIGEYFSKKFDIDRRAVDMKFLREMMDQNAGSFRG